MSYGQNSFKGVICKGLYKGAMSGVIEGETRSLDHSSYGLLGRENSTPSLNLSYTMTPNIQSTLNEHNLDHPPKIVNVSLMGPANWTPNTYTHQNS